MRLAALAAGALIGTLATTAQAAALPALPSAHVLPAAGAAEPIRSRCVWVERCNVFQCYWVRRCRESRWWRF
jgi:hypothetical protein